MALRTTTAFSISLLLHGLAIYGLIAITVDTGLGEQPTEIISESAIETIVVDAVPDESAQPAAASVAQQESKAAAAHEKEPKPPEPEPVVEQKQPDPPPEQQQPTVNEPAEIKVEETKQHKDEERRKEAEHKRKEEKRKAEKQAREASTAARGGKHGGSKGRVSASRGDMLGYASRVQMRVEHNKPPGNGRVGSAAVVTFGVSSSGNLTHVSVNRSSGSRELDRLAILAVRRANPFPPPPDGGAHTFTVPFDFK
jgi:periplasmic protein TonB